MPKYDTLPQDIIDQIEHDRKHNATNPYAFNDNNAIRRNDNHDRPTLLRTAFIRDIDKILNCPFYSRYSDKTQAFSFYKNDDITRRSLHVQLVSRIARTIGKGLNLNLELIEAIALGHDLGHTPFGHSGERILDKIYYSHTSRHFAHNLQSIRVLDNIFPFNMTLQTLDGIAGHNGEIECEIYLPQSVCTFEQFNDKIEACYIDKKNLAGLSPSTLEGCVVRISDIIAYLGKDRQDGSKTNTYDENSFSTSLLGSINAEIINNLSVNIVKNSYGKNYVKLDKEYFEALKIAKKDNYEKLYFTDNTAVFDKIIEPMMNMLYQKFLADLQSDNKNSPIFTHHIDYVNKTYYKRDIPYVEQEKNQIVVDYIASMTDDYFLEVFKSLFPNSNLKIQYNEYF